MGRPAGSKNKLPRDLRERVVAIADALETQGKGLQDEAEKDPRWFYEHFLKPILPKDIKANVEGDVTLRWSGGSSAGSSYTLRASTTPVRDA